MAEPAREILLGWRNLSPQAALGFPVPRRVAGTEAGARAAAFGPAAEALVDRLVAIRAPGNMRVRLVRAADGAPDVIRIDEPGAMSNGAFRGLVHRVQPSSQRHRDVPAAQMSMNVQFVCEAEASLMLMPPFLEESYRAWPGTLVCGRFPLRAWPRPLNAVLEWQNTGRDWVVRRGDALAYVWLDAHDPAATIRLVEAQATPALKRQLARIDNVSSVGRNVGPMFRAAAERRPARLLEPKETYADAAKGEPPCPGHS